MRTTSCAMLRDRVLPSKEYLMKRIATLFTFLILLIACGPAATDAEELPLRIFVSILPQSYFVERIGGEQVHVEVLVEPGKSPHTFEPIPGQMMALSTADFYFGIGFPFEQRILKKVQGSNPGFKLIYTDKGITRRQLDTPHTDEHHRERKADRHEKGLPDPHIWLSPPEIRIQVDTIYGALIMADPAHKNIYKANRDQFMKELDEIHSVLLKLFEPYRGRSFFVFHPAFGYFADTYGIVQVPIEIEGKSPAPRQIELLIEEAKEQNVSVIFVSPQFDTKSADVIAKAIGGVVVPIDPLEKNVLKNLEDVAKKIKNALR
jgi:zinc transport system substrate-binding protein